MHSKEFFANGGQVLIHGGALVYENRSTEEGVSITLKDGMGAVIVWDTHTTAGYQTKIRSMIRNLKG